ncbi:PREDICTED: aphrodisin-like [Condylura cristata]|uniref:aphrodisin-like n=1 Tax=Condylura cristata TaxID=143302 RepID=UPI000643C9F8|nr:PREDICTED: aphrodisin-like [Condylura cristata]
MYTTDFSGKNYFQFLHVSKGLVVVYVRNENGDSVTEVTEAFGKGPLTPEQFATYSQLTGAKGVPVSSMQSIPDQDTCPP